MDPAYELSVKDTTVSGETGSRYALLYPKLKIQMPAITSFSPDIKATQRFSAV